MTGEKQTPEQRNIPEELKQCEAHPEQVLPSQLNNFWMKVGGISGGELSGEIEQAAQEIGFNMEKARTTARKIKEFGDSLNAKGFGTPEWLGTKQEN